MQTKTILPRILSIDYGEKRCGLAATDPLQIIVSGLDTVETVNVLPYLKNYLREEDVEKIVIGKPAHADGADVAFQPKIDTLRKKLENLFPSLTVVYHNEAFSSQKAKQIIMQSGAKKKKRRDKGLVDKISAVVILQDYLGHLDSY